MSLTTSTCAEIEPLILVPAGLLTDTDRARVEAHLAGCEACRELADRSKALDEPLRQVFANPPPVEELARIQRRMQQSAAAANAPRMVAFVRRPVKRPSRFARLRKLLKEPWFLAPAAALAVLLLVALPLSRVNRAPGLEVELLGGRVGSEGAAAKLGLMQFRAGEGMRVRIEASRDGTVYLYRWDPGSGLEAVSIEGRAAQPVKDGVPVSIPSERLPGLEVRGEGIEAMVVVGCARQLDGEVLKDLGATGRALRPDTDVPSPEDLEVLEALTGCRARAVGYEVMPAKPL